MQDSSLQPSAAILWDFENTGHRAPKRKSEDRRFAAAVIHCVEQAGFCPCPKWMRAYACTVKQRGQTPRTASLMRRWVATTASVGFQMVWTGGIADLQLIEDVQQALRPDVSSPLPQLMVLLSDDRDFAVLLEEVRRTGRQVWVAGNKNRSSILRRLADRVLYIQDLLKK